MLLIKKVILGSTFLQSAELAQDPILVCASQASRAASAATSNWLTAAAGCEPGCWLRGVAGEEGPPLRR